MNVELAVPAADLETMRLYVVYIQTSRLLGRSFGRVHLVLFTCESSDW